MSLAERQHIQSMLDTSARVSGGIYVYLALWIVIAWVTGFASQQPVFVWCSGAFLGCVGIFRSLLTRRFPSLVTTHPRLAHRALIASVLANGLTWGLLTAVSVYLPALEPIRIAMILVAVGVCSAGSMAMAIDRVLKFWFPIVLIIPISISAAANSTDSNMLLASLIVVYTVYVMHSTGTVHRDYWRALKVSGDLERASLTDALTQVANRMQFDRQYAREWSRACRRNDGLAVLLIDLDHFKTVNDTYGHQAGDLVLQHVAIALQQTLHRAGDSVARYGGEEFVVLLPDTDLDGAAGVVQRILKNVANVTLKIDNADLRVTCSVGYAWTHPDQRTQPAELIKQADAALYEAKAAGRNQARYGSGATESR